MYNSYLESIDGNKRYLLQEDIQKLEQHKFDLDDQFKSNDISFFDLSFEILEKRIKEIQSVYLQILSSNLNFKKNEKFIIDKTNITYPKDKKDRYNRWRKYIKYNILSNIYDKIQYDKNILKKDTTYIKQPLKEKIQAAKDELKKTLNDYYDNLLRDGRKKWLSKYINSITTQYDPHTTYYAPVAKKKFDMNMSGQFEGIGARLQINNGYLTIKEVIIGGPAWKQGKLETEDIILKVAQENEEYVNIVGMAIDDAIELIKGKKGTKVKLRIKKIDGIRKDVIIVRGIVKIDETYVKSSIIEKKGKKYGIIHLPKFYISMGSNQVDCAKDVLREIRKLKKQKIEGIVLDLRYNGGGSLQSCVKISGYFIKNGPIVQVKYKEYPAKVLSDDDKNIEYDGPLVILVNNMSASASEILSAAMQDYGRAVIIGSDQTFGKGTVQTVYGLDNLLNSDYDKFKPLGALKYTIQKFYRVNGQSTQNKGVNPDIVMSDRYKYIKINEIKNAMKSDRIKTKSIQKYHKKIDLDKIKRLSAERLKNNEMMKLIEEQAKLIKKSSERKNITLNLNAYTTENEIHAKKTENMNKQVDEYKFNLKAFTVKEDILLTKTDTVFKVKMANWQKQIVKDVYIDEAINVLGDLSK